MEKNVKVPMNTPEKIGVLGGSFDPVHFGHLKCAKALIEQGVVDQVLFMPTGNPPHKDFKKITAAKHRLKMLKLAIQDDPHFELSPYEINRKEKSYTVDTLRHLKKENPEAQYFFILGADNLKTIHTWKNYRALIRENTVLLLRRMGSPINRKNSQKLTKYEFDKLTAHLIITPFVKTSATLVRKLIKHHGKTPIKHIPEKVLSYIYEKNLYS